MSKMKPAFIIRSFNDAGTLRRFSKGDVKLITVGEFGNWHPGGLVRDPTPEELKSAKLEAVESPAA